MSPGVIFISAPWWEGIFLQPVWSAAAAWGRKRAKGKEGEEKGEKVGKGETWTQDSSVSLPHPSHSQLRSEVCLVILSQFLNLVLQTLLI